MLMLCTLKSHQIQKSKGTFLFENTLHCNGYLVKELGSIQGDCFEPSFARPHRTAAGTQAGLRLQPSTSTIAEPHFQVGQVSPTHLRTKCKQEFLTSLQVTLAYGCTVNNKQRFNSASIHAIHTHKYLLLIFSKRLFKLPKHWCLYGGLCKNNNKINKI